MHPQSEEGTSSGDEGDEEEEVDVVGIDGGEETRKKKLTRRREGNEETVEEGRRSEANAVLDESLCYYDQPVNGLPPLVDGMYPDQGNYASEQTYSHIPDALLTHGVALPPEMMWLNPKVSELTMFVSNCMYTDPKRVVRIDTLEISDDDEEEIAAAQTPLSISIKREYTLGTGKFGKVYEGSIIMMNKNGTETTQDDDDQDRKVAIKEIDISKYAKYPVLRRLLDNEVSTLRQCANFPAIVQFEGFTQGGGRAYIVTEVLCGDLEMFVQRHELRRLAELTAKVVVRQILAGLNFLHHRGISHGDVKPSNVLMVDQSYIPQVKLADFGHVRRLSDDTWTETTLSQQSEGMSLPNNRGYRAPEHATARGFQPCLDMYGVGASTFFMLHGLTPYGPAAMQMETHIAQMYNDYAAKQQQAQPAERVAGRRTKGRRYNHSNGTAPPPPILAPKPTYTGYEESEPFEDLKLDSPLWVYLSQQSFSFTQACMLKDSGRRLNMEGALSHDWLTGFEMYSMLRRLECRIGLFRPSDRHLTTPLDDVHYQRSMLMMAANPALAPPPPEGLLHDLQQLGYTSQLPPPPPIPQPENDQDEISSVDTEEIMSGSLRAVNLGDPR